MAYLEVQKDGDLLKKRHINDQAAEKGIRFRLGSLGQVQIGLGETKAVGPYTVRLVRGETVPGQNDDSCAAGDPTDTGELDQLQYSINETLPSEPTADAFPDIEGYRIIERLGQGGMGSVWRAEQLSAKREVALKTMAASYDQSKKAQARFGREVELTASLDHSNIARLYDSGLHQGLYYYAMELIDGITLDRFAAKHKLSQIQIVKLVGKICQAVQFAHQRGMIHRDLKPSNIMVSPDGEPHIVDFGLARMFWGTQKDMTLSVEGELAGTPAYMSPEQAAGHHDTMDTRSDVFSLGVILYGLLTGESPHDLSGTTVDILQRIRQGQIRRPRVIKTSIDKDLEAILLKSLALDTDDRYLAAGAMADDLMRYLHGDPVSAQLPTVGYFLRKKARKYRIHIGAAALAALILSGAGLFGYTKWIAYKTRVQEIKLEAEQGRLAEEHPATLTAMNNLASLYETQGRYDEAEPLYRKTLEIRKRVLGEEHPDTLGSMNNLASLYKSQGRYDEAEALYLKTLEISKRVLGQEHPDTLTSMNNLASLYHRQSRYDAAEALYLKTLEISKRVLGEDHPNTLTFMNNLAGLYRTQGRYDEVELLAIALGADAGVSEPNDSEQSESETLGKLEYFGHLTRDDLAGVTSVEISPDGRHAYAVAFLANAMTVFDRDSKTGSLEYIQTISNSGDMRGAVAARISACGRYVLCTTIRTNNVNILERDQSTGILEVLHKVKDGENGVQNLDWPIDATFSLDSQFVYVIASNSAAVTVFRITDDRKLAFVECTKGDGRCFRGARGIAIGPKDKYLYVASSGANALVVLERNAETGKTILTQVIKDEQEEGVHGLAGAFAVACSPDGKFVYTSAGRLGGDNAVCVFEKMSDGTLSLVQEVFNNGQEGLVGFVGGNELRVSPDGQNLYAIGTHSNSVVVFRRNVETGELKYIETYYDSEVVGKDGSASGIGLSPDGEYVYVAGESDSSVLIFKRLTGTK